MKLIKYNSYQAFINDLTNDETMRHRRFGSAYFDLIENEIIEDEKKILELIESYTQISESLDTLIEKKSVFDKASQLLNSGSEVVGGSPRQIEKSIMNSQISLDDESGYRSDLNFIAGVIKAEDDMKMKRMIFRISKGRAIPTFFDLITENKIIKTKTQKKIFTIFFQGGVENVLLAKLIKVCDLFNASRFNIPRREEIQSQITQLQNEIFEKNSFLKQASTSIKNFLQDKVGSSIGNVRRYI
jgi:V-type H+-transporting ATPase subunit a